MFKINFLVYVFAVIFILIGAYKEFIIINSLIVIHELGHFLCAKIFKINTDKIYIYPLGGITKLKMDINTNPIKELIIIIMGPLFQVIAYLLLIQIFDKEIVANYHIGILIFNLLPIYPLDGGKILNIILNNFFSYKKTLKITILISYIITIIILFNNNKITINMILTYIMLVILIRREELKIPIFYQKFLLERYINNYYFKKKIIVNNINDLYKYRSNIIRDNNKNYQEKEFLNKKYNYFNKKY